MLLASRLDCPWSLKTPYKGKPGSNMIRYIKLLRNIGTFDSDNSAASLDLKRLALIYADNGRGKTTVAAVFRSLTKGDQLPIAERKRLGSEHPPYVVLDCEGEPSNVVFESGRWNRTLE